MPRKIRQLKSEQPRYSMVIQWSDEDQAYLVSFPEWEAQGLIGHTHGEAYEDAARKGREVLHMLVESARAEGGRCRRHRPTTDATRRLARRSRRRHEKLQRGRMTPRLETPRLILRQFAPSDWDAVNTMLSDPVATQYMHFATWTDDQRRQWFDWCITNAARPDTDVINWAITQKDTGNVIGWFGIGTSSEAATAGERSLGYLLNRAFWNQGYMTEALRAVLAYEFDARGAPRTPSARDV